MKKLFTLIMGILGFASVNAQCTHTLNLTDTWGDGWGGGSVDVVVDGATVLTGATCNGPSASLSFDASQGSVITLTNWTSDNWPGEYGWEILNGYDNGLLASGVYGDTGPYSAVCEVITCPAPTDGSISAITNNSATLSWIAGGSETEWNLQWGEFGFGLDSDSANIESPLSTTSLNLSGLSAFTAYSFYVQASCTAGSDESTWAGPFSFQTNCDVLTTFPYMEDFNSLTADCWTVLDNDGQGNAWGFFYADPAGDIASLAMGIQYEGGAHDDYLISPQFSVIDGTSDGFQFTAANRSNAYPELFDVLVSTTGKAADDFVNVIAVDQVSDSTYEGQYQKFNYNLSDFEGQDIFVAIRATSTNQWVLYVDDVKIGGNTTSTTTVDLCDENSYDWNGETYTLSGSYDYTTTNADGFDSTATLVLSLNSSSEFLETLTVCDGVTWNGTFYDASGNDTYTTTNEVGCDSVVTLALTVNASSSTLSTLAACESYDWSNGETYTESGTYLDTTENANGCPQYDSLVLTITTEGNVTTTTECDSYEWNGTVYTESGDHTYSSTPGGCEDELYLTIINSSDSEETLAECDSAVWNGLTYLVSGEYTFQTTNAAGCDSVATLNLTINNSEEEDIVASECTSYDFNGEELTESGIYIDTTTTDEGCVKIVTLNLTVLQPFADTINETSCDASFDWNGETLTESGFYYDSLTGSNGCDSITVLSLDLASTVSAPFNEDFNSGIPSCWTNETSEQLDWSLNAGGTPSGGTGPSDDVTGGGAYMYVEMTGSGYPDTAILYTADYDISGMTTPELAFASHMLGVCTGELSIKMIDGANETTIFTKAGSQGDVWFNEAVALDATGDLVSFEIMVINDSIMVDDAGTPTQVTWQGDIAIDNFGVREMPSCYTPFSLFVDDVLANTATIGWYTNESVSEWTYLLDTAGFDPTLTGNPVVTDADTVALTGLDGSTDYEYYVMSNCDSDNSEWAGPFGFTTLLNPGTCGYFTIELYDSYGDGWNGNFLEIVINDVVVDTVTQVGAGAAPDFSSILVAVDIEDVVDVNYLGLGTWQGENSYIVYNSDGDIIAEAGAESTAGLVACPQSDMVAIAAAVPSGCDLTAEEPIEIWVYNAGIADETGLTVSYAVNGGAAITESIADAVAVGDTLMYVFTQTADMSAEGDYDVTLACTLAADQFNDNDTIMAMAMNTISPSDPTTMGDTSCIGSTANLMATSDEYIVWYNAEGNVVGTGESLMAMDSVTSSYYAEAVVADGYTDDFESYSSGDFIAESNTEEWATWPGGTLGGQYDAPVSDDQAASGSNSLHLDNAEPNVPDPVMIFGGQTWNSGTFEFSMNLYVVTSAYFNLQGSADIGTVWAMQVTFDAQGAYDFEGGALTGSYPGTGQWFNITLKCNDLTTSTWELFIDGESQGSATLPNGSSVGGCNFYAADGNDYYIDDVSWTAASDDACRSDLVEVVSTVEECLGINGIASENIEVYPNPNNGEFMVSNTSEIITITITDVQGKTVHSMNNLNIDKVNIDMTDLEKGMYLINIETGNGTVTKPVMLK